MMAESTRPLLPSPFSSVTCISYVMLKTGPEAREILTQSFTFSDSFFVDAGPQFSADRRPLSPGCSSRALTNIYIMIHPSLHIRLRSSFV